MNTRLILLSVLALLPAFAVAAITWRLIWPPWKRVLKLFLHPIAYFALVVLLGGWGVLVAWVHQGIGLAGHIWFSRKHGFRWYAVEDPVRYRELSREWMGAAPPAAGATDATGPNRVSGDRNEPP